MSSGSGPGTIPLDNMRVKMSYSEAAAAKDRTKPSPKPPKAHDGTRKTDTEMDTGTDTDTDTATGDGAHKSGPLPLEQAPVRKYSMPINARDVVHEDMDEGGTEEEHPGGSRVHSRSRSASLDDFSIDTKSLGPDFGDSQEFGGMGFGAGAALSQAHIQELYATVNALTRERQIAEEKAERASERVAEMKQLVDAGMSDISKDTRALAEEIERLRHEKRFLKEQLSDAQSHIFSLQPYRKDMTPEEVRREYDDLVESVQDWVQKLMGPVLDDVAVGAEEIMSHARHRPSDATRFKKTIRQYPDLVHASMLPETDEDIIVGVILRYLHDNIFQKILYGSIQHYTEIISFVENLLQTAVEPKRDLFSVRTWTAEAYNALLSAPQFKSVRDRRRKDMMFKDKTQWLCEGIQDNCIEPAMRLYEKFQVSTHHFYLDANPFMAWGSNSQLIASPEFVAALDKLDCRNILQNRKAFSLAKLDPQPSKKELHHHLLNVCTVVPALCMRQIGQRDAIKEPTTVRRQQMLVAWGPEERRKKFVDSGDRTIVSQLYLGARSERSESSWASSFRWG
ncbi:hypothetical protein TOPH_01194 [Tolypocladium ophioglossoides CBS 100239]|uniref:Uncharacterized protein n=1 Tax=Tolypocladium ophioglossoides (strain CBS 100239) TaxID=1163406 RepID=A0A0L0NIV3_TOLOC|nr:hypothetical protein TOPH_01194 [Tolypocladium ophioglossoides CBS 100239]